MTKPLTKHQKVARLRRARAAIDDVVRSKVDVCGSMIGVKLVDGIPTGEIGITYLVGEKVPLKELTRSQRIPEMVELDGASFKTDVVVLPRMVNQSLGGVIIHDGASQGTLSCFAEAEGELYGMTCGHCLWGVDQNPTTPTDISIFVAPQNELVPCGRSVFSIFAPSFGLDHGGFVDCGVFSLQNQVMQSRAKHARPLRTVPNLSSLLNTRVFGISTLQVTADQQRTALVLGVEMQALEHRSDLVLRVDAPGTYGGDSGMLWLTKSGQAVGLHTRGEQDLLHTGSRLTTAMSAARAASKLGVRLLYD